MGKLNQKNLKDSKKSNKIMVVRVMPFIGMEVHPSDFMQKWVVVIVYFTSIFLRRKSGLYVQDIH
jgi:hypothetical protein